MISGGGWSRDIGTETGGLEGRRSSRARATGPWWYVLASALGVAAGFWRTLIGIDKEWTAIAVIATWGATALLFRVFFESDPRPLGRGSGRETWKADWLVGFLFSEALMAALAPLDTSNVRGLDGVFVLVSLFVVTPLMMSAPMAILRRQMTPARAAAPSNATTLCLNCGNRRSVSAPSCWSCRHHEAPSPAGANAWPDR